VSVTRIRVAIVGAGGLAWAMARALSRSKGASVAIASRKPAAAAAVARGLPRVRAERHLEQALAGAEIVLLAVPDRAVTSVAEAIAPLRRSWRGIVVLHAAGAYGPELLVPLRARGASTGVLHPLAVLGANREATLAGAYARIEGRPAAVAAARRVASLCGLVRLRGPGLSSPSGRKSYHAAASLVSNDLVALLAAGQAQLVRRGVRQQDALAALTRLAAGALDAVQASGLSGALTGPVARNDAGTLAAQLAALAVHDPVAEQAHRALSLRLVVLAAGLGRLDRRAALALTLRLARGPGRSGTV